MAENHTSIIDTPAYELERYCGEVREIFGAILQISTELGAGASGFHRSTLLRALALQGEIWINAADDEILKLEREPVQHDERPSSDVLTSVIALSECLEAAEKLIEAENAPGSASILALLHEALRRAGDISDACPSPADEAEVAAT